MTIVIGILGAPVPTHWRRPGVELTADVVGRPLDGLVTWGAPSSPRMLDFTGPKAWYTDEPLWFLQTQPWWRQAHRRLDACFLHHSRAEPALRVRSVTHYGPLATAEQPDKASAAVAVASKFGGRAWWLRGRGLRLRNSFLTSTAVELYGDGKVWSQFRRYPWSRPATPPSYRGELGGSWLANSQIEFLSRYKVVVCLENAIARNYFTEKFVNVARAGSIPVYHAEDTVRREILAGARWIDPADHGFDPARTIRAALAADLDSVRSANFAWLRTPAAKAGDGYLIWDLVLDHVLKQVGKDNVHATSGSTAEMPATMSRSAAVRFEGR